MEFRKFIIKSIASLVTLLSLLLISSCKDDGEDKPLTFSINTSSFTESNSNQAITITVVANQPVSSDLSITYSVQEDQAKFITDLEETSGTLNFNSTEATVVINLIGDTHAELQESFNLVVNHHNQDVVFKITILDNDSILPEQIQTDADGFITPEEYPSMELFWSEEFSGDQLSNSNWNYEIGNGCDISLCGWGNNELQSYTNNPENIHLEDGKLVITARNLNGNYTSARIKTQGKKDFRFGRIDIRARLPKGQGIWPAIWMLGSNITSVSWPNCGEIDIMELVGHEPKVVHGTVHYFDGSYKYNSSSTSINPGDFSDQFHVFSILWDQNKIQWYVDNQLFKTFTNSGVQNYPFNNNFFFILNIAVGGNWPGSPDDTTVFPQEMVVDYIRVFH